MDCSATYVFVIDIKIHTAHASIFFRATYSGFACLKFVYYYTLYDVPVIETVRFSLESISVLF